jgi:hypothetical protein
MSMSAAPLRMLSATAVTMISLRVRSLRSLHLRLAWMAQLWSLSAAEWFRLRNELLGEVRLLLSPWDRTAADLARELNPNQRNASYYAAQVKDIVNRIKELDRTDDSNP